MLIESENGENHVIDDFRDIELYVENTPAPQGQLLFDYPDKQGNDTWKAAKITESHPFDIILHIHGQFEIAFASGQEFFRVKDALSAATSSIESPDK